MPHRSHAACVIPYIIAILTSLALFGGYSYANPDWPRTPTDDDIRKAAEHHVSKCNYPATYIYEYQTFKLHQPPNGPNEVLICVRKDDGRMQGSILAVFYWLDYGCYYDCHETCEPRFGFGGFRPAFASHWESLGSCAADIDHLFQLVPEFARGWLGESPPSENRPPTVRLSYSPANPMPNDTIYFQADASDPDGDPLTYRWFLNDVEQTRATAPNVQWANPALGTHTMRVVVSDGRGGMAEDSVEISVGVIVEFVRLETGISDYAPGDTVKVIYELTNPGTAPADYHVKYVIFDPSGKQVYEFIGTDHTIPPGENQAGQSTKWTIPADATPGSYEVQAKCISTGGIDEESTFFDVVSEPIEVSYTLGYDMPMSESEPVALRVTFRIKDEFRFVGIVSISINEQKPGIFFRYPAKPASDPLNRVEYDYPGVKEAQYDFYVVKLIERKQTVSFIARLEVVNNENSQVEEIAVPFTVNIEAAFTVYVDKPGDGPTPPLLNGRPLQYREWTQGVFGEKLRLPWGSRVVIRELSGASYAIQDRGGNPDLYWELSLGPWNLQQLRDYQMEDASTTRLTLEKIGKDKSIDKTLEVLFKKVGKKVSGPLGIILDVFEGSPIGDPSARAVLRLRSTVGVTIAASGEVTVRTFEGSPEIVQPDGSVLALPVWYEASLEKDGKFAAPRPYDPSNPSVRIWADEIGQYPSDKTIEQALDTNNNKIIDDFEMLQALQYWIKQQTVPGTNKTIDDLTMLALLQKWIKGTPIQ